MYFYLLLCLALTLFYIGIMSLYYHFWVHTEEVKTISTDENLPTVTIIIPVRNESENIAAIINDLLNQSYPKELIEIIIVDDFSEDNTAEIVKEIRQERVKLLQLEHLLSDNKKTVAYKKKAIEIGVQSAKGSLIMTTDGDCRVDEDWVKTMVNIQLVTNAKLLTGAVVMSGKNAKFQNFQTLDFLGMMGVTAAMLKMKIYNMANGANLLYEKSAFEQVKGFQDINHISSGDDMLLIYKIAQEFSGAVAYAKHPKAIVYTETATSIKDFLQQRFRWTAKSKDYQDKRMTLILGTVFLFVLTIVINAILAFKFKVLIIVLAIQILAKCIVDFRLLKSTSSYYNRKELMDTFFSSQLFHILYIVIVGCLGNILNFEWKGRKQVK